MSWLMWLLLAFAAVFVIGWLIVGLVVSLVVAHLRRRALGWAVGKAKQQLSDRREKPGSSER
jgi:uncharacterized membrane protein YciS (DUF1049 family)